MATELDIPKLVAQLQQGGSTPEAASMLKETLCQVVTGTLADVNRIAERNTSQHEVTLEFLSHMMTTCPQIFVSVPNLQSDETPGLSQLRETEDSLEEIQCYDLNCWIIAHLLGILAHPKCAKVHEKTLAVVPSLLQTIRPKDPHLFWKLSSQLIYALADLCQIHDQYFEDDSIELTARELERFLLTQGRNDGVLKTKPIVITGYESCQDLQKNISKILLKISLELCQFCADDISNVRNKNPDLLWASVSCQLEYGNMELKKVSLELANHLLEMSGLPQPQVLDYFVRCVVGLITLLSSGHNEIEGDYVCLEMNLVSCLNLLVSALENPSIGRIQKFELCDILLEGLMQAIVSHGLQKLRTNQLKESFCCTLTSLYQTLPDAIIQNQIMKKKRMEVDQSVIEEIGLLAHSQAKVKYLCQSIQIEAESSKGGATCKSSTADPEPMDQDTDGNKLSTSRRNLRRKRTHSSDNTEEKSVPFLKKHPVVNLLLEKLSKLCESLETEEITKGCYIMLLDGVHDVIEVLVWGAALCRDITPGMEIVPNTSTQTKSPAKPQMPSQDHSQWLPLPVIQRLCEVWKHFLKSCKEEKEILPSFSKCYLSIIQSIGSFLFVQDLCKFPPEVWQAFVWIVTLHWLPNDISWIDLKLKESKEIAKMSSALADYIDTQTLVECVRVNSQFAKEITSKWRTHILKQALGDTREEIRIAAVESFPNHLYYNGPSANHLVYEVFHGLIQDKAPLVLQSVAQCIGPLACVVSRKAQLERPSAVTDTLSYKSMKCVCTSCDKATQDEDAKDHRPKVIDPQMFQPFLSLLEKDNKIIKLNFTESLARLFGHIGVRANNPATVNILKACLELMEDPERKTRLAFSKVVIHFVGDNSNDSKPTDTDMIVIRKLKTAAKNAKDNSDAYLMQTVLITVGQLGRVAEGDLLLVMIISLLDSVCYPSSPLAAAVAHAQLKELAQHKGLKPRQLFLQFGRSICKVIVDHMHEAQRKKNNLEPGEILKQVANVFGFEDVLSFLTRTEQYVLPHLVKKATPAASVLIRFIAKQLGDPNHKGPLVRNMSHIFCHLVCHCQSEELIKTFTYLEGESEWDLRNLLICGLNVDSELLLHLSSHFEKVLTGIKILFTKLGMCQGNVTDITDEAMADMLQPKLLGILVHFDNILNNSTVPLEEKKQAYESVISLMRLMGSKRITSVRVRVMTTLRIGLKFKEKGFPELCCRAWNCFVHSVDITSIGSMVSQILVSLLPLLQLLPKQVSEIFNFLIVENRKVLKKHFHELYFVPDIPELADVNAVLKKYTEGAQNVKELKIQIEQLLKGISHESLDVRQLALSKLKNLLHNNQYVLHKYILESESADPVISQIVKTLLAGCREPDLSTKSLYGECLGTLGAVDPGRLELMSNKTKKELTKFPASVTDDSFAVELINELSTAFLRAEDRNTQDCVAFAIQELIQVYGIAMEPDSSLPGARLWKRFSEEVQEIMEPLMHSRYMLTRSYDWSNLPKPIYRSKKGNKFVQWVCNLSGYLGSKVKHERAKKVFEACRGVVRNDSSVALYLLPHVIVHVLLNDIEQEHQEISKEILAVLNHVIEQETRTGSASDLRHMSAQTVFSVLDHLTKWTRHRVMVLSVKAAAVGSRSRSTPTEYKYSTDPGYLCITRFLARIQSEILAFASYNCGAFTRALMHFEQFIKQKNTDVHEHLDFMQKLYVALDEPDGVAGVTATKTSQPSLSEQILAFESIGQLSDASVCYDRAIQLNPSDLAYRQGLLKCKLALGELNSAMDLVNGMIAEKSAWGSSLNSYRVESAWKLGQWDKLQTYLKHEEHSRKWNIGIGKILLAAKYKDEDSFKKNLQFVRNEIMGPLSAASMEVGSYHRGYEYITRLHMLNEVEQAVKVLLDFPKESSVILSQQAEERVDFKTLKQQWAARLEFVQASYKTQEPILNLRRIVLGLAKSENDQLVDQEIGQCWLQSARMARECSLVQTAHSSLLSASAFDLPEYSIEKAKWLWDRGDYDQAQSCLEKAVEERFPDKKKMFNGKENEKMLQTWSQVDRISCAKILLLLGTYCEETASLESNDIMKQYKEVIKIHGDWEDGYFHIAKYYDKIMTELIMGDRPEKKGSFVQTVVHHFGLSLQYGNQYIYQSMPRMLSLWLDYGSELVEVEKKRNDVAAQAMRTTLATLNKHIGTFSERLAPYQFLTAFPQLISRICHTREDVFSKLMEIIAKLMVEFPQQTMWQMMAVSKSTYPMRVKRCQEIYNRAKCLNRDLNKFLQDATKLTDRLLDLCNRPVENGTNVLRIAQNFKPLQRLLDDSNFSEILLPLQSLMTVTLPSGRESLDKHDPFPGNQVYIAGIEDTVEVLPSLQRPKKITLRGSNGLLYIMLCKPKDDLRKDARLMEFNAIVNKCLRKDPESRRRDLHIRTYTVTPLNEECGLLEWVSNTEGLRNILLKLYKERGKYTTGQELRSMQLPANAPLQKKMDMFLDRLLPKHPPIFSEWFLKTFPDPTSWYNARLAYCRTTAVMSVVGYMLGLGDRHGENILLDSTNGDCFHVDFNCLFNKGETFDFPEIVPFRLTHNMVDAMGPMGYEGIFRRACEVTLRVMRNQRDPLMSVLKTFIYDPLVEWSKPTRARSNATESGEIKNDKAFSHVSNIESRLKGTLKNKTKPRGLPLSVEGHVNHLIKEATDIDNLCQMYIGWAPYL